MELAVNGLRRVKGGAEIGALLKARLLRPNPAKQVESRWEEASRLMREHSRLEEFSPPSAHRGFAGKAAKKAKMVDIATRLRSLLIAERSDLLQRHAGLEECAANYGAVEVMPLAPLYRSVSRMRSRALAQDAV